MHLCFFCSSLCSGLSMTDHYYIHIPFCRQRCPYCKFALTPVFDEFKKKRYIEYLKKEIREYFILSSSERICSDIETDSPTENDKKQQKTIYFGGWTPSVLSHDEILSILECFPFWTSPPFRGSQRGYLGNTPPNLPYKGRNPEVENLEITMEMNPEDVTPEYIEWVLALGINRISLWIQTLNEASLKEIHRSDRNTIFRALESMNEAHISLNIDFILGLPFVQVWETLSGIKELHQKFPYITHTSVYMLEDEKYPKHWRANSITEDDMRSEFLAIMDYFKSIWWHHYELSNWARPGYESVHNQAYWDHSETRGFGLSAASFEWWKRWSNASSFSGYYGWKRDNEEKLTPEQIKLEEMMFGLRRDGWISPLWRGDGDSQGGFVSENQSNTSLPPLTGGLIANWLIEINENRIKPTKTWIFVIDHILSELISDL